MRQNIPRQPISYLVDLPEVSLQVTEWPGNSDPVLLLHATGFHSRCWDSIARPLQDAHIYAVDARFHGGSDRNGPVNWKLMAGDIEQLLQRLDLHRIVGVGHSMGGFMAAFAAARQPHRFKQLLLIDPVILAPEQYEAGSNPSGSSNPEDNPVSRRKNSWQSSEEMYQRFRDRAPFNTWQDQVLRDYCEYALRNMPDESFMQLACDPLHEASIYINHQGNEEIHQLLPRLDIPVTVMRARHDPDRVFDFSYSPTWPGLAAALPQGRDLYLPELSHFIPMEDPDRVALEIRRMLETHEYDVVGR